MDTIEIRRKLREDYFCKGVFKDVLPIDKLPLKIKYPSSYVVNTDPSYMPGQHWLALHFD